MTARDRLIRIWELADMALELFQGEAADTEHAPAIQELENPRVALRRIRKLAQDGWNEQGEALRRLAQSEGLE